MIGMREKSHAARRSDYPEARGSLQSGVGCHPPILGILGFRPEASLSSQTLEFPYPDPRP